MLRAQSRLMLSKSQADSGELARLPYGEKSYRYYAYDLLDWTLAKRAI